MTTSSVFSYDRQRILDAGILALIFSVPLFRNFSTVLLGVILLVSLVNWFSNSERPSLRFFWFLPVLFLYFLVSNLFGESPWPPIERKLSFVLFPVVFALNPGTLSDNFRKKAFASFIGGTGLAASICLIRSVVRSVQVENGQWGFNPYVIRDTEFDFFTSSVMGGNFFFGSEYSWFVHPTYFGLYIVFAQALLWELSKSSSGKQRLIWIGASYIFFMVPLYLLSSRAAIISSILLTVYVLFNAAITRRLKVIVMILLLLGSLAFFSANPRTADFTGFLFGTERTIDPKAKYGFALRLLSWDASLEVIRDNWLLGVGEGNKETALVAMYNSKGYNFPAQQKFNSHNQYFDIMMGGGIFALGLFLAGMIHLLRRAFKQGDFPLGALLGILLVNAFFENLLGLYAGVSFFSLWIALLGSRQQ